jgi:FtsP/CotA-like multicopper oxidase with cupredoxin domain
MLSLTLKSTYAQLKFTDHSHNMGQYPDGLRGPLIIHDPWDPYQNQYDEEIILTVSDWYA